jgi:hypothetical protein
MSDINLWAWVVFGLLAVVGALTAMRWPGLTRAMLVPICIGGLVAYLLTLRILAVDPERTLGFVPLWRPLAWLATGLALFLPFASSWAIGVGGGSVVFRPQQSSLGRRLGLLVASLIAFEVGLWCLEVVAD